MILLSFLNQKNEAKWRFCHLKDGKTLNAKLCMNSKTPVAYMKLFANIYPYQNSVFHLFPYFHLSDRMRTDIPNYFMQSFSLFSFLNSIYNFIYCANKFLIQ